jgi:hypothetical protein
VVVLVRVVRGFGENATWPGWAYFFMKVPSPWHQEAAYDFLCLIYTKSARVS